MEAFESAENPQILLRDVGIETAFLGYDGRASEGGQEADPFSVTSSSL